MATQSSASNFSLEAARTLNPVGFLELAEKFGGFPVSQVEIIFDDNSKVMLNPDTKTWEEVHPSIA